MRLCHLQASRRGDYCEASPGTNLTGFFLLQQPHKLPPSPGVLYMMQLSRRFSSIRYASSKSFLP